VSLAGRFAAGACHGNITLKFLERTAGSSYSGAAANIPAINKMNPRANERSSGWIDENMHDAQFGIRADFFRAGNHSSEKF
jgi:hypothetical protein